MSTDKLGEIIRLARQEKGWSQRELARRIGKSPTYVHYVERNLNPSSRDGTFQIGIGAVDALAKALDIDRDELRIAAGYAPEHNPLLKKPETMEDLMQILEAIGMEHVAFYDAEKYNTPESVQRALDTIRFALDYARQRGDLAPDEIDADSRADPVRRR